MSDIVGRALVALRPGASWSVSGNVITWLDAVQTQPTQTEIDNEVAALQAADTAEATRIAAVDADAGLVDLINKLKTMTPTQWQNYLTTNVTSLQTARDVVLYRMGLVLMLLAKKTL